MKNEWIGLILQKANKHLPEIAIFTGTVCEGIAIVCGIKETPKAMELLQSKKPETFAQKAETVIPCYWKTILFFIAGTTLILAGTHMSLERTAIALGIAATQKDKLAAMTEETKKLLGPKKSQELEETLAAKKIDMDEVARQTPIVLGGDQLFVCDWNNYAFRSSVEKVQELKSQILKECMRLQTIDKADVEQFLGMPIIKDEYQTGWNIKHPPELKITGWMDGPDGKPMGILSITPDPQPEWVLNYDYI